MMSGPGEFRCPAPELGGDEGLVPEGEIEPGADEAECSPAGAALTSGRGPGRIAEGEIAENGAGEGGWLGGVAAPASGATGGELGAGVDARGAGAENPAVEPGVMTGGELGAGVDARGAGAENPPVGAGLMTGGELGAGIDARGAGAENPAVGPGVMTGGELGAGVDARGAGAENPAVGPGVMTGGELGAGVDARGAGAENPAVGSGVARGGELPGSLGRVNGAEAVGLGPRGQLGTSAAAFVVRSGGARVGGDAAPSVGGRGQPDSCTDDAETAGAGVEDAGRGIPPNPAGCTGPSTGGRGFVTPAGDASAGRGGAAIGGTGRSATADGEAGGRPGTSDCSDAGRNCGSVA
jgi:hypothetical protein